MRAQCIKAVTAAIGRALTAPETKNIEDRLARVMREQARKDPQAWMAKSQKGKLQEAAIAAADEIVAEAHLKQERESLTIAAHARLGGYTRAQVQGGGMDALEALNRTIAFHADGKSNTQSVETASRSIERDAVRRMLETFEAAMPKFFGLIADKAGERDLLREIMGEKSGNSVAAQGAKLWKDVTTALRERFNAAGGDIHELLDWALPHHHSQVKVAKAGRDKWVADTMPLLNRSKYYNGDGTRMSDAQISEFLGHVWTTIATGGANKLEPGQFSGGGARANRGSESRQVHYKDADSFLKYQDAYGDKSVYEVLLGHVGAISKDIALVETYGPNPDHTFRLLRDQAVKDAITADPLSSGKIQERAEATENLYNEVAGKTDPVASARMAAAFDTLRAWLVASRLGSSVITSFSDDATMHLTAHLNNLSEMQLLANEFRALNPANRIEERMANRAGLALNTMIGSLNRFGAGTIGQAFARRLAGATIRASGLNAMTEARRRAFGVTMMSGIGAIVRDHANLAAIDPQDHRLLLSRGISDTDFAVWKLAQLEDWGGGNSTMLTPEAIYRIPDAKLSGLGDPRRLREQAVTKFLGSVLEESDVAVIEPGARDRAVTSLGAARGTLKGELARSLFLFKSFPLAMISRHWARGMSLPNAGGRVAYIATLIVATTVLGMASLQVNELVSGRDPRNINPLGKAGVKNWIAAMMKGGSLGIYGDFLFSDSTQYGNGPLAAISGPVFGLGEDFWKMTQGNLIAFSQGKRTQFGGDFVRFLKSNTPGASLWYAKAALDHLIYNRMAEYFSPGYLSRMRSRAMTQFNQNYWWEPQDVTPQRPPDLSAAVKSQ